MKRKQTRKQRFEDGLRRAAEADQRRQQQVNNQLTLINRLLVLQKAYETFFGQHEGLLEEWEAYIAHVTAEPCWICGDAMNHYGEPHGVITGDGKTRADVDAKAAAAEPEPVGLPERDAPALPHSAGPSA